MQRRSFLQAMGGTLAMGACTGAFEPPVIPPPAPRLFSRPSATTRTLEPGLHEVVVEGAEITAYLPESAADLASVPLLLFLHGSFRSVHGIQTAFAPMLESAGVMMVAPLSRGDTWDAIHGTFGPDPLRIDRALTWAMSQVPISPSKVVISGVSDGASYSLALGRANGDLFSKILAFAPGFVMNVYPVGAPPILVSHGTNDTVLPFGFTEEIVVPTLRNLGYQVEFLAFDGEHGVYLPHAQQQINLMGGVTTP